MAVSPDESGETALEWLMSELVEDGDEVVAIRVIEIDEGGKDLLSSDLVGLTAVQRDIPKRHKKSSGKKHRLCLRLSWKKMMKLMISEECVST